MCPNESKENIQALKIRGLNCRASALFVLEYLKRPNGKGLFFKSCFGGQAAARVIQAEGRDGVKQIRIS